MKFCPFCGAQLLSESQKFCAECGSALVLSKPEPTDRPEPASNQDTEHTDTTEPVMIQEPAQISESSEMPDTPEGKSDPPLEQSISVSENVSVQSEFSELEQQPAAEVKSAKLSKREAKKAHGQEKKPRTKLQEKVTRTKELARRHTQKKQLEGQPVSPFDIDYDGYYDDVRPSDSNRQAEFYLDRAMIKRIALIFAGACVVIVLSCLVMIYL